MADIKQQIEIALNKEYANALKSINMPQLMKSLQKLLLKLIIKRISEGYDIHSRKFGNYNTGYDKTKAIKYASKKYGTTEYMSTSKSQKLRLTGNLLSSLASKEVSSYIGQTSAKLKFRIYIKDAVNELKAEGLQSTTGTARNNKTYSKKSYEFFGLALSGDYATRERKAILDLIGLYLKNATNGRARLIIKK